MLEETLLQCDFFEGQVLQDTMQGTDQGWLPYRLSHSTNSLHEKGEGPFQDLCIKSELERVC